MAISVLNSHIDGLPAEIQTYILSKLDGVSAVFAKRVCRRWNELLSGLETCLHFWLRKCIEEIPSHILVELTRLENLSSGGDITMTHLAKCWAASLESILPWTFWREVYAEYHRACYIKKGSMVEAQLHFSPACGEVSCLHIQDGVIYSGHESGIVMSWDNITEDLNCAVQYSHHKRVTCIAGLDQVTSTKNVLNGRHGCKLVSSSRDTTLIVHNPQTQESNTIKHFTKQINCVSCWGNHFIAAADRCMIQGLPIWTATDLDRVDTDISITLQTPSVYNIKAVAILNGQVVLGDDRGNVFMWSNCLEKKQPLYAMNDLIYLVYLQSPVKSLFLLGQRLVCLTGDGVLHVSEHQDFYSYQHHDIYGALFKTAECVAVKGSILAIGCKSGFVYLYWIPKERDWDDLDLSLPDRVVHTSCDHVNALAIGDNKQGPFISVATEENYITVVLFGKSNGS